MGRIVTLDGPAGSGKSTVARLLAARLGCLCLDTGAMYRVVALAALQRGIHGRDEEGLRGLCREIAIRFEEASDGQRVFLGPEDVSRRIRYPDMDMLSSEVSGCRAVREAMVALQRRVGAERDLVAEGRDMGTIVFPEAPWKFFLTASEEVRAGRRYLERKARGEPVTLASVQEELAARDLQDTSRNLAPLRPAADAVLVDTGAWGPEEVVRSLLARILGPAAPGREIRTENKTVEALERE